MLLIALSAAPAAIARGQGGATIPWDQKLDSAIGRAREFLWSNWSDGHWPELGVEGADSGSGYVPNYGGATALCAYTLLSAGESPDQPRMKQTLAWLAKLKTNGTYTRALRAAAWASLGRKSPYEKNLLDDVNWLLSADKDGAYTYYARGPATADDGLGYDNYNSQLAVMGVWAGARKGVPVSAEYWKRVEKHWLADQRPDGGWSYQSVGPQSRGTMSAAGLATLFVCFDKLHSGEFVAIKEGTEPRAIAEGLAWLNKNFEYWADPNRCSDNFYYYLYALERAGLAGGYKDFGGRDWYRQCAETVLRQQGSNGGWGDVSDSALALLFLARGRYPVAINKLRYDGLWNCRPHDVAHLAEWLSDTFERDVHWQIVDVTSPLEQWQDAPILYISGATAPTFSDEQIARLRDFVLQGGTIFSEAAGSRSAFTLAMRRNYARMFPRFPLVRLEDDHPVYSSYFRLAGGRGLLAVGNGVRLMVVHSPVELSLAWQLNRNQEREDAFKLATNVLFFVTDRANLRRRGTTLWPTTQPFRPPHAAPTRASQGGGGRVKVAVVKYDGNWDPEPLAWKRFAILLGQTLRLEVEISDPMAPEELKAADWPLAALSGAGKLNLTGKQVESLRKYVAGGGVLVIDAAGGDASFGESAKLFLNNFLPGVKVEYLNPDNPVYVDGPALGKVSYRRTAHSPGGTDFPRLMGLTRNGRSVVVFSPEDLTAGLVGYPCWGLEGYQPQSAFELMRNIVIYGNTPWRSNPPRIRPAAAAAYEKISRELRKLRGLRGRSPCTTTTATAPSTMRGL